MNFRAKNEALKKWNIWIQKIWQKFIFWSNFNRRMNFFKNETFKTIFEYCESFVSSVSTSYYDIYYRVIFGIWRKIEVKLKICIALVHPLVKKHIHLSVSIILCCFSKNQRKLHAGNWTSFVCCQSSQCLQKWKKVSF